MEFLRKNADSEVIKQKLFYKKQSDRPKIREILLKEQLGFCAYSEKYIVENETVDIEHFDDRIKDTNEDSYYNWYVCLTCMNRSKSEIAKNLPVLHPSNNEIKNRIYYEDNQYYPSNKLDLDAINLIKFLGFNRPELSIDRQNHINKIKFLKKVLSNEELDTLLYKNLTELSFPTALKAELGIDYKTFLPK